MIVSTLRRKTTVIDADEFAKRQSALAARLTPLLAKQPGFVAYDMQREGEAGGMAEVTRWQSADDCRGYLRNGAAAMAATLLDAFFPTAAFPDGNWVRENIDQP